MGKSGKLQHVASLSKVNAPAEIIQLNYTLGRTENETALDILDIFIDSEPHKKIIIYIRIKATAKKNNRLIYLFFDCKFGL